jgi:molecular chaperone DnaK
VPQIEVTFDIDANGILNVSARDKATNKEQRIRIEASTGLNKEEISKMERDAREHAAEDKKKRELVEAKNYADQLIYQTEKNVKDMGDKLDAESTERLQNGVQKIRDLMKTDRPDEIKSACEQLNAIWNEVSSKMYERATAGGPQPGATNGEAAKEKVEEADFEVVDEDSTKK